VDANGSPRACGSGYRTAELNMQLQAQLVGRLGHSKPARSSQMVNCLRDHFLYSEKRARDLVFLAIERIICSSRTSGTSPILSRLTRESIHGARLLAHATGFEFSNWEPAGKAVFQAMLDAEVLLTQDGSAVPKGILAQATGIAGLREDFRDFTEAYLLEFLIRKLGDVCVRDHRALAHALFRQFDPNISMEDFEDRVVILLATLSGRVVLREDGTYAIRVASASSSPEAVTLSRSVTLSR
jgi:hypothetical protein